MNILHVLAAPAAGGAEIYVKDLAKALAEQGVNVHIGFLNHGVEIGRSQAFENSYLQDLSDHAIQYFFFPKGTRTRVWRGVSFAKRYVKKYQIDVFHSHLTYGIVCGSLLGVPRFYTHHNIRMRVSDMGFSILNKFVDEYVAISEKCHEVIHARTRKRVTTIYNGIDFSRLSHAEPKARKFGLPLLCVAVGHICPQKNYDLMLDAILRMDANAGEKIRLKIVGDGAKDQVEALKRRIRSEGLDDVVEMLGHRNDVPKILSESQLLLMSSAYEGLPIALIEAAASGVPAIVTDVGGCSEIVANGESGIVVPPDNSIMFARALGDIFDSPECIERWSAKAIEVSRGFSIESASRDHLQMYENALA